MKACCGSLLLMAWIILFKCHQWYVQHIDKIIIPELFGVKSSYQSCYDKNHFRPYPTQGALSGTPGWYISDLFQHSCKVTTERGGSLLTVHQSPKSEMNIDIMQVLTPYELPNWRYKPKREFVQLANRAPGWPRKEGLRGKWYHMRRVFPQVHSRVTWATVV